MLAFRLAAFGGLALAAIFAITPAQAMTMKDCSAKYKAAQTAGTLDGMKWNDFRKASCGPNATMTSTASVNKSNTTDLNSSKVPAPTATRAPKDVVFPKAIDPKYSNDSSGLARLSTCLDQYHVDDKNKQLGGLSWYGKGGYYSLCNARLKS